MNLVQISLTVVPLKQYGQWKPMVVTQLKMESFMVNEIFGIMVSYHKQLF